MNKGYAGFYMTAKSSPEYAIVFGRLFLYNENSWLCREFKTAFAVTKIRLFSTILPFRFQSKNRQLPRTEKGFGREGVWGRERVVASVRKPREP
jgi:hypothetical protein